MAQTKIETKRLNRPMVNGQLSADSKRVSISWLRDILQGRGFEELADADCRPVGCSPQVACHRPHR